MMTLLSRLGRWLPVPIKKVLKRGLGLAVPESYGYLTSFLRSVRGGHSHRSQCRSGEGAVPRSPAPGDLGGTDSRYFRSPAENIREYPEQRAFRYLVADEDGRECILNIADNWNAQSSSILDFAKHRELWPNIGWMSSLKMHTITLPTLVAREGLDLTDYDALVLDTQGSELLILKGSESILLAFRYIQVEVADFEAYKGGARLDEIRTFMASHGFREVARRCFAGERQVGNYFDMLYARH